MTIVVSDDSLDILGESVFLANTPTFLWRKLAERPTIQVLSRQYAGSEIEDTLRDLLDSESLQEREVTLAYCLLVAWLLQGPAASERAAEIPSIEKLPLAKGLVASRSKSHTSMAGGKQPPRLERRGSLRTTSSTTERTLEGGAPR
jgi:hypothetical protein